MAPGSHLRLSPGTAGRRWGCPVRGYALSITAIYSSCQIEIATIRFVNAAAEYFKEPFRRELRMQEYGSIIAQIVTSAAQIPVAGATLTISRKLPDGGQELLAVRMSDYDGFTEPFELPTPPASDSQTRQTAEVPYALVDLRTERTGYGRVLVRGAQVFSGVQTLQQLVLIPMPTLPENYAETQEFDIPAQEL